MPTQATLIRLFADGPVCPMLKRGSEKAAAASAEVLRKSRRVDGRDVWGEFITRKTDG
jgi:hypothetical protein